MVTVGLLGCGNVGQIIAQNQDGFSIIALFDKDPEHVKRISSLTGAPGYTDFESFIREPFDLVVEAASGSAVREYAAAVLNHSKDIVILSVGALSDASFCEELIAIAGKNQKKIHIPSGAIMGLDNLTVGRISPITRLELTTTKSPKSLNVSVDERTLIFKGKANDCIRQFPKNVNVSVALALATGCQVDVKLYADPAVERNIHEIFVEGAFGEAYIKITNQPSPDNPATSYLAALSILSLLRDLTNPLVIGR